ncbi:MAG: peptide chain release factor N(5)-glutamine methyltransferase [Deltaproteobacteria bacterium]|nr:peptide chain release factor N(5)-glutamine methyltransferase [Deltaproteobacteria bacterium]
MKSLTSALQTVPAESVRGAVTAGTELLRNAGIDGARLDAEVLLRDVLAVEKTEFFLRLDEALDATAQREFQKLLLRRARREPVAYIIGRKEFWSLDFVVTPAVLIPRPETELLVELALARATQVVPPRPFVPPHPSLSPVVGGEGKGEGARDSRSYAFACLDGKPPLKILDLGTGSGAIAVSLAKELPQARVCAVDISAAAIEVARLNARRHGVEERMEFFCGDLFEPVAEEREGFDLIVANPPYIRNGDLVGVAPEIRKWEPIMALNGGADGLLYYRRIVAGAGDYLKGGGSILIELGDAMGDAVARLFADAGGFEPAQVYRDYAGKERVIAATKISAAGKGSDRG